ncbi:MAG: ABC transporter permease [Candidatus Aminicenantes bacterium 4484_214]|nr:MAG: ABC transporter permease [Candidatus Aminicenantes bacterium 4484_214]RLE09025.1 MAG: ABC transporter permease [Candidatus Aminicenantes bacterium]
MDLNKSWPAPFLFFWENLGELGLLTWKTLKNVFRRPWEKNIFLQQLEEVGVRSLLVVSLTAAFGGLVFGLQTYIGFHRYVGQGSEAYGGPIISLGLSKELIPILVGLMVAGRVGSAMTAEIGTMKITEQIDALFSLGADPNKYLVVPRTVAAFFMLPCLTLYGDLIGIVGGFFYNIVIMGVNSSIYLKNTLLYFELWDLITGLIKAAIFGLVIALVGCWQGMKAEGGAAGVGRATTRSVVISSIVILILNFFLSKTLPASLSR